MLHDCGLSTPEDRVRMAQNNKCWPKYRGCVNSLICEKCLHIISDSICLCGGIFTCPNCGHRNGSIIERTMRKLAKTLNLLD